MRERYDYLTTETEETLDGNVKAAAYGLDKTSEAVYQIQRCEAADPFAHFRAFAKGLAKGQVSLHHYISHLDYLEEKYVNGSRNVRQPNEAFTATIHGHNQLFEEYIDAIQDGTIDAAECDRLIDLLAIEKPLVAALETALLAHKAKLEK